MGACIECGKIQKSEIEESLSSLLNSLLIRKISNTEYVKSIKNAFIKNKRSEDLKITLKELIRPTDLNNRSLTDGLQNYIEKLNEEQTILFSFGLIFLTKYKDNISIERNYYKMKEIFKRRIDEYSNCELIKLIITAFGDFITTKLFKIYLNNKMRDPKSEEVLFFNKCYSHQNLNEYLSNFFNKIKIDIDYQTENFFMENLKYIEYDVFSQNLKNHYKENKDRINSFEEEEKEKETFEEDEKLIIRENLNKEKKSNLLITNNLNSNFNNAMINLLQKNHLNDLSIMPLNTKLFKRINNLKENNDSVLFELRKKVVNIHNNLRSNHSAENLIIDEELQKFSQNWAEILSSNEKSTQSTMLWKGNIVGENIYQGKNNYKFKEFNLDFAKALEDIINDWYEKKKNFDYELNTFQIEAHEFSQIVWKRSTCIGIGFAESKNGVMSLVINYFPVGNTRSDFIENVLPN
jgi:hypothetical protein